MYKKSCSKWWSKKWWLNWRLSGPFGTGRLTLPISIYIYIPIYLYIYLIISPPHRSCSPFNASPWKKLKVSRVGCVCFVRCGKQLKKAQARSEMTNGFDSWRVEAGRGIFRHLSEMQVVVSVVYCLLFFLFCVYHCFAVCMIIILHEVSGDHLKLHMCVANM